METVRVEAEQAVKGAAAEKVVDEKAAAEKAAAQQAAAEKAVAEKVEAEKVEAEKVAADRRRLERLERLLGATRDFAEARRQKRGKGAQPRAPMDVSACIVCLEAVEDCAPQFGHMVCCGAGICRTCVGRCQALGGKPVSKGGGRQEMAPPASCPACKAPFLSIGRGSWVPWARASTTA